MPSPRPPSIIQDRIAHLEASRATLVEHVHDMHGSAQWEACVAASADLMVLGAEIRSLRWALGNQ